MPGRIFFVLLGLIVFAPLQPTWAQTLTCSTNGNITTCPLPTDGSVVGPNSLIQGKDGLFYGTTAFGGNAAAYACQDGSGNAIGCCVDPSGNATGCGTVFRFDPSNGGSITVLYNFTGGTDGGSPTGLMQGGNGSLYGTTTTGGTSIGQGACLGLNPATPGDTTDLKDIGCGVIFQVAPTVTPPGQTVAPIYSFLSSTTQSAMGAYPNPLVQGAGTTLGSTASFFYGTALGCNGPISDCGSQQEGAVFSVAIPETGTSQVNPVYQFVYAENQPPATPPTYTLAYPNALIQGMDGNLYGTAQLEGNSGCMVVDPTSPTFYGCGGAFVINPVTSAEAEAYFGQQTWPTPSLVHATPDTRLGLSRLRPNAIVRQPQHSFPSGGTNWPFASDPVMLAETADGNIYGTTPPICADVPSSSVYQISTSCGSLAPNEPSMLFQLAPASSGGTLQAPSIKLLYLFGTATTDGGGSLSGLTLASDGQLYGSSGNVIFDAPASGNTVATLPIYANLGATYSALVQGSNGNFYGVTAGSNTNSEPGEIFELPGPSGTKGPVQLSFSANPVNAGSPTTLTWSVNNAFSLSAQQCYAFAQSGAPGGPSWTGLQQGATTGNGWGGSLSITPTATGTYTYAVTCGGNESATATLTVNSGSLTIQTPNFPTGVVGSPYSVQLQATGGVGPYIWTGTGLPSGLTISSSGLISGTPTATGTVTFTVQVADAENPPATATANFSIQVMAPALPSVAANPTSVTISSPGGTGSTTLNFANFTGSSISVTCTGAPQESTCNVGTITANSATLTITTTAPSSSAVVWSEEVRFAYGWLLPGLAFLAAGARRRRWLTHLGAVLLVVAAGSIIGCGGGSAPPPPHQDSGTPTGTYALTVTATSGSQTAMTRVTLTVQ